MKYSITVLCLVASTSQSFMIGSPVRPDTKLYNLDKSFEDSLKKDYPDASRATILECDDENCVQVQCELQQDGSWKCEDGLESDGGATSKTVLMTSENDD